MRYSSVVVAAAAFTGYVSAQNYSTSGPISVVPSSVDIDTRQAWCRSQLNLCPMICGGSASPNTCDATTLNYTCTCTGTGSGNTPNFTDYMGTVPFFECEQWIGDCTAAHPNDLTGQTACQSVKCGTKNASEAATTSSASSSSASATGSSTSSAAASSATGAAGGSSSTASSTSSSASASTSSSAAKALSMAKEYSAGVLLAGAFAVFGFAL